MSFVDKSPVCMFLDALDLCTNSQLLSFSGWHNGHACGLLSVSTSATLAHRPLAWLTSVLDLFLFPSLMFGVLVSKNPTELVIEHNAPSVGMGICLISIYWGLTLLVLGTHFILSLVYFERAHVSLTDRANCCSPMVHL